MTSPGQIVVLSSVDWAAAWQRHQIFAAQFAAAGHEVFFVENTGFRNPGLADLPRVLGKVRALAAPKPSSSNPLPAGLRLIAPKVLPPTFKTFRALNRRFMIPSLLREMKAAGLRENPTVLCYFATATTLEIAARLKPSLLVYDCASNFRAHPAAPADFPEQEKELLRRCRLVVCDSDFLFDQKRREHGRVAQIHQGVAEAFFGLRPPSGRWRSFCYYGTWSKDLDPAFPAALAEAGLEVTVSGYVKEPAPPLPSSVRRLAPASLEELPRRLEGFDGLLLPYRIDPFLMGVVPAKIYECLASGRPILATPLPSLKALAKLGLIHVAESPKDWVSVARGLASTESEELRQRRIAAAREHSHAREFERLRQAMREAASAL